MNGRAPLIDEARKEMSFALNVLEGEFDAAAQAGVPPVCDIAKWLKAELAEKLGSVCQEMDEQLHPAPAGEKRRKSGRPVPGGLDPASQLAQSWQMVQQPLAQRLADQWSLSRWDPLANQIDQTWQSLDQELAALPLDAGHDLKYLFFGHQTRLVREYTDMWTIYSMGWAQLQGQTMPLAGLPTIVDRIVDGLYAVICNQGCCTYVEKQDLIPVFYENEAFTRPSRQSPVPYIVIPRWSLRHLWLGNAIAHEVGHNVLWNVQGLFDELLVVFSVGLASAGFTFDRQRVWGRWMEEIFADLFALLQIGPAVAGSLQRMLAYVPNPLLKKLGIGLLDDVLEGLRGAYDAEHPVAYLRGWLSLAALDMLVASQEAGQPDPVGEPIRDGYLDELRQAWRDFIEGPGTTRGPSTSKRGPQGGIRLRVEGSPLKTNYVSARNMLSEGQTVLEIMLYTPLQALAVPDGPPRSMVDVFYHKPEYARIEQAAQDFLTAGQFSAGSFAGLDLRTVLAAAEYAFERASDDQVSALSGRVKHAIMAVLPGMPAR
jgi:hypothetical protein